MKNWPQVQRFETSLPWVEWMQTTETSRRCIGCTVRNLVASCKCESAWYRHSEEHKHHKPKNKWMRRARLVLHNQVSAGNSKRMVLLVAHVAFPPTAKVVHVFSCFLLWKWWRRGSLDCRNYMKLHALSSLARIQSATLFKDGWTVEGASSIFISPRWYFPTKEYQRRHIALLHRIHRIPQRTP
jgi:hypothetical protein